MLGIPVENVAVNELGGLGDAMCSAVGTGLYKDFQEAFEHMSKPGKRFEPRIDQTAIYDRKYKAYESVLRVTDADGTPSALCKTVRPTELINRSTRSKSRTRRVDRRARLLYGVRLLDADYGLKVFGLASPGISRMGLMKGNENMASKHVLNCAPFIVCF